MNRVATGTLWLATILLGSCTGDKGDDGDDGTGSDGGALVDGGTADGGSVDSGFHDGGAADGGATGMPPAPDPFTLQLAGGATDALYFDEITCSKPYGSNNFRVFWRDSTGSHVFVLAAELLGSYTEPGTYTASADGARVRLQEEAGYSGQPDFYMTDTSRGDEATIVIDYLEDEKEEVAWGEFSFTSLHATGGGPAVTATPQPIPIWCASLD
ncbi:MAG: hypothetical protein D6798_11140 [Deltaproteobacteria bacterium]|nr:MAG: hypothetical protein D6798_11140 [Deltaproteobacteria bacterium]